MKADRTITGLTFILCLVLVACSPLSINEEHVSKNWKSIQYASDSPAQNLDIYLPKQGQEPYPAVIYIHGGAFLFGNKYLGADAIAQATLVQSYAFVTIEYRLSDEALFPAAADDALAATRYVKENAQTYGIDPNRIVVWGASAGANLAVTVATKGNIQQQNNVQAAVNWFGPMQFDAMDAQFAQLGLTPKMGLTNSEKSPESKYLGKIVGSEQAAELVKQANPATYIDANDPPMYIQHGDEDRHIPYLQSKHLAQRLAAAIGDDKVVFELLEGAEHGGKAFEHPDNLEKIFTWLKLQLQ